ncbi:MULTISPECIES: DUF2975 domain-containing protein [unclassified Crossiella]|uniref:DUF2975 domain-containing protein n=1 Tax=unclassified Crossiella TaxID=2620835 RepID=UPI001FFFB3C3|nr:MULTISPECIES: DUF2975 domain-containing protein [unclassified Crossiella]MCK2240336.1 DUF2975 domain-containing protein [Crossiella sp. S99.2]MCK2253212.1 DUF2975 domain-containing protein [Crossiella sp. S99.1]
MVAAFLGIIRLVEMGIRLTVGQQSVGLAMSAPAPEALAPGFRVGGGIVTFLTQDGSAEFFWLVLLTWLPYALIDVVALLLVARVMRRVNVGERPMFAAATVRSLRHIGFLLLLGNLAAGALDSVARSGLTEVVLTSPGMFQWPDGRALTWALVGLAALAGSEIVRRGVVLRDELEGTV